MLADVITVETESVEDFYAEVVNQINRGEVDEAVPRIVMRPEHEQLEVLTDLARDFALDLELATTLERALALARARDLALELARAHDLAHNFALDLALSLTRARDIALTRARDLALALALVLDRPRARALRFTGVIIAVLQQLVETGIIVLTGIESLTPQILSNYIAPYLQALIDTQQIIAQVTQMTQPFIQPRLSNISQSTPISIQMEGVAKTVTIVRDYIIPWRRKQAQLIADLEIARKQHEIARFEVEIHEIRLKAAQARIDAIALDENFEQKSLETSRARLNLEEKRLEIERKTRESLQSKIDLALNIIEQLNPSLSEKERIVYVNQLLEPLNVLIDSPLEIAGGSPSPQ